MARYCESDVDILRRACMSLRDLFISLTGIDPLSSATTIASACNLVSVHLFSVWNLKYYRCTAKTFWS